MSCVLPPPLLLRECSAILFFSPAAACILHASAGESDRAMVWVCAHERRERERERMRNGKRARVQEQGDRAKRRTAACVYIYEVGQKKRERKERGPREESELYCDKAFFRTKPRGRMSRFAAGFI